MEWWMHQGTTMGYGDINKDFIMCNKYGFNAIEMKYNLAKNFDEEKINELINENRVRVGSLSGLMIPVLKDSTVKKQCKDRLISMCQFAKKFGTSYIIAYPARGRDGESKEKIEEELLNIFDSYMDVISDYGVKLAVEVNGYCDSYLNTIIDGLEIIDKINSESIGLVYDFYHVLGTLDLGRSILSASQEKIFIVHVGDGYKCAVGKYLDANRLWPGEGDVDYDFQFDLLKEINYQGVFSIEVYQSEKWKFDIEKCYQMAAKKSKELESIWMRGI